MNKDNLTIAGLILIMCSATLLGGYMAKQCKPCLPCEVLPPVTVTKYIQIKHTEKQNEIKRDYEKKIDSIDSASVYQLDSIWTEYTKRYSKNSTGGL